MDWPSAFLFCCFLIFFFGGLVPLEENSTDHLQLVSPEESPDFEALTVLAFRLPLAS